MSNILKKPYELSIWENKLESVSAKEGENDAYSYYDEVKLGVIGSDTMTSLSRATNIIFTKDINNGCKLSFDMYRMYYDNDEQDFVENPWFKLLVNERKVKLHYDDEWYDFIIKDVSESSIDKKFSFSCVEIFVNELSKNGYDIQLNTELSNNSGTIEDLAEIILEGSDWNFSKENTDLIYQEVEEPVYQSHTTGEVSNAFNVTQVTFNGKQASESTVEVAENSYIALFYSDISSMEVPTTSELSTTKTFDRLYIRYKNTPFNVDQDNIIDGNIGYLTNVTLTYSVNENIYYISYKKDSSTDYFKIALIDSEHKGKRLVRAQKTKLDTDLNKLVKIYKKDSQEYYGYETTEYTTSNIVTNFVLEDENFIKVLDRTGVWSAPVKDTYQTDITLDILPEIDTSATTVTWNGVSYLKATKKNNTGRITNNSFYSNTNDIFETEIKNDKTQLIDIAKNTELLCIADIYTKDQFGKASRASDSFIVKIINTDKGNETTLISFDGKQCGQTEVDTEGNRTLTRPPTIIPVDKPILVSEAKQDRISIVIEFTSPSTIYLQNFAIFRAVKNTAGGYMIPGITSTAEPKIITHKIFYEPGKSTQSVDYIVGQDDTEINKYIPQYFENYNKIRSIEGEKSNRFNLLQQLCETFECWARYDIQHDDTGKIQLEDIKEEEIVVGKRQKKTVYFKKYTGDDNYIGFKYGINLNSIQRTLNSDKIVTKLIVSQNSNEFGTGGFCTIARAADNAEKNNFILNFDYYIQQGLLSFNQVYNDLYSTFNGNLGYLYHYQIINKTVETLNNELSVLKNKSLTNLKASYTVALNTAKKAKEQYEDEVQLFNKNFSNLKGVGTYEACKTNPSILNNNNPALAQFKRAYNMEQTYIRYDAIAKNLYIELYGDGGTEEAPTGGIAKQIKDKNAALEVKTKEKEQLDKKFFQKYSQFIQEGTWISEDYYDDNLYYLDAKSVSYTSKSPEVVYDIKVVELSQLEGYENFHFNVGDKTFIEDVEFFGYDTTKTILTPYKEEIIVSAITYNLDDPTQNTITVQNYKTQFEDLFQRISATTQAVEYKSGSYDRTSSVMNANGTISTTVLEASLNSNPFILSNCSDNSVVWNEQGITITNLKNPYEIVRIVSGGIMMSTDGGNSWSTGITGSGINANVITTGILNAAKINIFGSADTPLFRWDASGINAYRSHEVSGVQTVNYGHFVRFDQYGVYGLSSPSQVGEFTPTGTEEQCLAQIMDAAQFGLIWDNFFLKTNAHNGMVKISSQNDFQVLGDRFTPTTDDRPKEGTEYYYLNNSEPYGWIKFTGSSFPLGGGPYYTKTSNEEIIKIGLLDGAAATHGPIYGIRINDISGNTVMKTGTDGKLWLKNLLKVGDGDNSTVSIGFLPLSTTDPYNSSLHQVINSNQKFIVWEDGHVQANSIEIGTDGVFNGSIYSSKGLFGNSVSISQNGLLIYEDDGTQATFTHEGIHILSPIDTSLFSIKRTVTDENNKYIYLYDNKVTDETQFNQLKSSLYIQNINTNTYRLITDSDEFDVNTKYYIQSGTSYQEKHIFSAYEWQQYLGKVYIKNGDTYEFAGDQSYDSTKTYYERTGVDTELIFGIQDNNLFLRGTIQAQGGSLSNLNILENVTIGQDTNKILLGGSTIQSSNYTATSHTGFCLSSDGSIVANTIHLGISAQIDDYLQVGSTEHSNDAYIYNPDKPTGSIRDRDDNLFIQAKNIKIFSTGRANFGNINIYGNTSTIETDGWTLTPDYARFHNIYATGKIETSVFDSNTTRMSGGMMIFKDAEQIDHIIYENNKTTIYFKDTSSKTFVKNDYVTITNLNTSINIPYYTVLESTNGSITIEDDLSSYTDKIKGELIFKLRENDSQLDPYLIGINATNSPKTYNLYSNSLTFNKMAFESSLNTVTFSPEIILGDITAAVNPNSTSRITGLYANNAFLRGQLTTQIENNKYAGVSSNQSYTLKDIGIDIPSEIIDTSQIVFWAGASNTSLKNSTFAITASGTLYATRGYFKGNVITNAIITQSDITATNIKTPCISGWDVDQNTSGPLRIVDITHGIYISRSKNDTLDQAVVAITNNDFRFLDIKLSMSDDHQSGTISAKNLIYDTELIANQQVTYNDNIQANKEIHYGNILTYKKIINTNDNKIIGYNLFISKEKEEKE